ncbi:retrovirus-related pol polyprotein from transposon TNT 1-94 [Tanacetum coccineum]
MFDSQDFFPPKRISPPKDAETPVESPIPIYPSSSVRSSSPCNESFENNDLKAQLQAKVTTICKLKEHIKMMRENDKEEKVKHEMDEIETINIELEHRKETVENTAQIPIATTVAPGMFKLDLDPLAPRLLQNREAHIYYLKHTQEQADILRVIVKQTKGKQPLDNELDLTCKHAKRIQELLVYVRDMCPNAFKLSEKKVAITPMNKVKKVRVSEPLTSSSNIKQAESSKPSNSNTPMLSSTGLKCSTSTCRLSRLFSGTVQLGNDQVVKIIGYGDYQLGNVSHLNFGTLNKLSKDGLARVIPKLKFQKDHLCSACALGKIKKSPYQPKAEDSNQEKLYLLHMDLYGPISVESINGKKSKDEAPDTIIKCIKNIQVGLNATVCNVRTNNGTEFVNQTLCDFYENVSIPHQTSVARTPQQNSVVERQNRTLMEAARIMLIFSKAHLFLWAESIKTTCYTQNRSLICLRYNKTPYALIHNKKLDPSFLHVFGSLCYLTNDSKDLGKLNAKADIGIFVGYAPAKKAFRIYNRRTRKIMETIHVTFDELTAMASEQFSLGPGLQLMTPATTSSGLVPNPIPK